MTLCRWIGSLVVVVLVSLAAATQSDTQSRFALVIGNGNYAHVARLANPPNDADAISAKLSGLGFSVTKVVDLDLAATRDALAEFSRESQGADVAMVFYAGHGLQVAGENYLLPVDARVATPQDLASASLRVSELHAAFAAARPGLAVLILDACRDNPFADAGFGRQGLASGSGGGLEQVRNSAGVLIAFAAAPGAVAADGVDGNSPFTTALLQWIDRPGLEIGTMFRRVRQTVVELTGGAQVPWVEEALLEDTFLKPGEPVLVADASQSVPFDAALLSTIRQIEHPTERRAALEFYDRLMPGSTSDEVSELQATRASMDAGDESEFVQHSLIWLSIRDSADPEVFRAFMEHFPDSAFVDLARIRLAAVEDPAYAVSELASAVDPGGAPALVLEPAPDSAAGGLALQRPPEAGGAEVAALSAAQSPEAAEAALGLGAPERIAVQRLLAEVGHYDGVFDGSIGPMSRRAIEAFQAAVGLPATGFLDPVTLGRLVEAAAGPVLASGVAGAERAGVHGLAAVAAGGAGAAPTMIRVASIDRHDDVEGYWRKLANQFEADHPGFVIAFTSQPDSDYKRNLLVMLGSEAPPDIFYTWGGGHLRAVSEAGFARDLTDEMAAGWAMQFKPGALENLTLDQRIHGVPIRMTLVSLWGNRRLLESVGIDPNGLDGWTEFEEAIRRLKQAGTTPLAAGGADRWPLQMYWGSLAEGLGGQPAFQRALAGEGSGFEAPVFVRAGSLLQDLGAMAPFQPAFLDATDVEAVDTFVRGEAAMILAGSWTLSRMRASWPGGREGSPATWSA